MPYIKQEDRLRLFQDGEYPRNAGELNFCLSMVIDQYWHKNGENYQAFNDIIGALGCVEHEYYRRKIAYYENTKLAENGEVYQNVPQRPQDAGKGTSSTSAKEPLREGLDGQKVPSESNSEQAPEGC